MKNLERYTGLYPVSKILCLELQPIGKTKEKIENNGILKRDEKRALSERRILPLF